MTELEMKIKLHSIIDNNSEFTTWTISTPHIMMLIKQAVEEEREACAKVCESMRPSEREFDQRFYTACTLNANAIRARRDVVTYGETTSRGNT